MVSEKFRQQLRQEVEEWRSQGWIDSSLYERLAQHYQFNALETAARQRFTAILLGLGGLFLGLAAIIFVAANWQNWSRELKVILLLSLFIAVNSSGFYWWRQQRGGWRSRFGQSLLLAGGFILGANLVLMSQMFHQSSPLYHLFLIWGLGVVLMAYSLRLTMLAMLALILISLGYLSGVFPPSPLYRWGEASVFQWALQHLPLLASAGFLPLAYWCPSRWLFTATALLVAASLQSNLLFLAAQLFDLSAGSAEIVTALAATLPPACLWGYRDRIWEKLVPPALGFESSARKIAVIFLSLNLYVLSFRWWWLNSPQPGGETLSWQAWTALVDAFIFAGFTLYAWWKLGYEPGKFWQIDRASTAVGAILCLTGLLLWWHGRIEPIGAIAIFSYNALLFLLALGCLRDSLASGVRQRFWWGMALIILQLSSRMLEYNTDLLFKAIVLFSCGLGAIFAGLWFERYLLRRKA